MFVKPYFFDSFRCKASECTDSCCIGWEIDIDNVSLERYNAVQGEFGRRLHDNITTSDDCSCFSLLEGDRCPFLNSDNLCDIYINLGEESLCNICTEHPRFYNEFAGRCEAGIGLCCERVCEIIFSDDKPLSFEYEDDGYPDNFDDSEQIIVNMRQKIFDLISDRTIPFAERLKKICNLAIFGNLVDVFANTEPINDEWCAYVKNLQSVADKLDITEIVSDFDSDYEKLFIYIVYRHFIKAVFDGEAEKWLLFCIANLLFVCLMDKYTLYIKGEFTAADRVNNVKLWSKQIEYSEDNIDFIKNAF